jgi:hypothetical protein
LLAAGIDASTPVLDRLDSQFYRVKYGQTASFQAVRDEKYSFGSTSTGGWSKPEHLEKKPETSASKPEHWTFLDLILALN